MKKKLLITGGIITLVFAAFHLAFPSMFGWETDLVKLTSNNKGIFLMFHAALIYLLVAAAFITFKMAGKSDYSAIERFVLASYAGFYLVRIAFGPVFFKVEMGEIIVWVLCLVTAACYIIPISIDLKNK